MSSFDYDKFVQELTDSLPNPEYEDLIEPIRSPPQDQKPSEFAALAATNLVEELAWASTIDDATLCATKRMEEFENFIRSRVVEEARQEINKGRADNTLLKRAFVIQHQRQKKLEEDCIREFDELKKLVSRYQEEVKKLEAEKYALAFHLKRAHSTIPGTLHQNNIF
ncbi:hypothetical protein ACFE04_015198 [Oxalis oulophora]